jgi:RNA polymerase-binding transcription factor DksA
MPLTPDQLTKIENRLLEERARLVDQLNEFTNLEAEGDNQERSGSLSNLPFHQADLGTDTANEELEASIATRRSAEIGEIDAALERLRTSPETFGIDENSGESIPFERLDLIPWARTAVPH